MPGWSIARVWRQLRCAAVTLCFGGVLAAQVSQSGNSLPPDSLPTELPDGSSYVGSSVCVKCHAKQSSALKTSMGRALQRPLESEFLKNSETLTFKNGPYSYEIKTSPQGVSYSVTDGKETIAVPILWSLGHGKAGQTYVFERDGIFYESRVSYFLQVKGLDQTLGAPPGSVPRNLEEAAGRRMPAEEVRACFGCHSTGAFQSGRVRLDQLTPGLQCEGCHGPGTAHMDAVGKAQFSDLKIRSLKDMLAEDQSDFCGSCHRTWSQVMLMNVQGPPNVRFQPYRLANSRCYSTDDARIRCTACHDPHQNPVADAAGYDAKCLACHQPGAGATAPKCPTGTTKCTDCHMPRVSIPGAHFEFTDHQIRVVRPGDAYPN